jgi:hypothetical protein
VIQPQPGTYLPVPRQSKPSWEPCKGQATRRAMSTPAERWRLARPWPPITLILLLLATSKWQPSKLSWPTDAVGTSTLKICSVCLPCYLRSSLTHSLVSFSFSKCPRTGLNGPLGPGLDLALATAWVSTLSGDRRVTWGFCSILPTLAGSELGVRFGAFGRVDVGARGPRARHSR